MSVEVCGMDGLRDPGGTLERNFLNGEGEANIGRGQVRRSMHISCIVCIHVATQVLHKLLQCMQLAEGRLYARPEYLPVSQDSNYVHTASKGHT